MSGLRMVVVLAVSLLMMQVDLGLAQNGSITIKLESNQPVRSSNNNALQAAVPDTLAAGLFATIHLGLRRGGADAIPYTMLIDTGKNDMWIIDQSCRDAYCIARAAAAATYSGASRLTFFDLKQSPITSTFSNNRYSITGLAGIDQMNLPNANGGGDAGGQRVYNMEFLRVSSTKGFSRADRIDGFLGLGNQAPGKNIPSRASVLDKMVDQGIISSKVFTISGAGATTLTFGDVPTLTNPVNYVKVANTGKWNFKADLVTIDNGNGRSVTIGTKPVMLIESIIPNIGLPTAALKAIAKELNAVQNPITKLYIVDCATTNNLLITINNVLYTIPPDNYINKVLDPICTLNFFESKDWILGQTFLTAISVVFDGTGNQLGFSAV